jgi:hypothetical protein
MNKPATTAATTKQGGTSTNEKSPQGLDSTHAACTMESKPATILHFKKSCRERKDSELTEKCAWLTSSSSSPYLQFGINFYN